MAWFWVDDELVAHIWARSNPKPFETPSFHNSLRRVLGMPEIESRPDGDSPRYEPWFASPCGREYVTEIHAGEHIWRCSCTW